MKDITQKPNKKGSQQINAVASRVQLINADGHSTVYLNLIRLHRDRTGVGSSGLLKDRDDIPVGLNKFVIENWLKENTKSASSSHIAYVLDLWSGLPDAQERILLEPATRQKLVDLFSKANITPKTFLKTYRDKSPVSFKAAEIEGWTSGDAKTAIKEHLDFTINQLESLVSSGAKRIMITPEIRAQLLSEKKRTGITPKALLKSQSDIPQGLIKNWVGGWLSGKIDSADADHVEYVLNKWRAQPKAGWYSKEPDQRPSHAIMPRFRKSEPDMVELTEEIRGYLRLKFRQTGITLSSFLRRFSPVPTGLTQNTISRWMTGQAKMAKRSQLQFVLNCLHGVCKKEI